MEDTNLKGIVRTTQYTFNSIAEGTHATEEYSDANVYAVELDDSIVVAAEGSGMKINDDGELVLDLENYEQEEF